MITREGTATCAGLYEDLLAHLTKNGGYCERQLLVTIFVAYGFDFRTSGTDGRDFVIHPEAPHLQGTIERGPWLSPKANDLLVAAIRAARTLLG